MLSVEIPGWRKLDLEVLLLDYNGTLALNGKMFAGLRERIARVAELLEVHVLTSDTFGTAARECEGLPVKLKVLATDDHTREKSEYVRQVGSHHVVAVGNGANDVLMLERADLGIAVIGPEGCAGAALRVADVAVATIDDALGLLLAPQRLVATLRR